MLHFINMKKFLKENYYLVILWIFCAAALLFFLGHFTNIMLDFGREVYYPQRILEGKVLYKDLFAIYGPFSYLFNAMLYKFFGAKLGTLYFSGVCCSFLLVSGIYLIARKFLSGFLSFSIGLLTIAAGVSTGVLFNFSFPYSWAMLYGTIAFLYSVLFLIKYKQENKPSFLYISSLLAGVCTACKYEFGVYSVLFAGYLGFVTVIDLKKGLKAISAYLSIPLICLCILLLQGLGLNDIITSFKNIKNMSETQTLKYFYQSVGVYFHLKVIPMLLFSFFKTLISLGIMVFGINLYERKKVLSIIILLTGAVITYLLMAETAILTLIYLPLLLIITSIICLKKIKNNSLVLILVISSIALSLKSIWALMLLSYASYYAPIIIIAFLSLLSVCTDKKYQTIAGIYLLILAFCIAGVNFSQLPYYKNKIETEKGSIYTSKPSAAASKDLINYINSETTPDESIVILPEGLMIDFLTDRKSDDYFNSMLPLYVESFGEEKIVKHFEENKPDYFVLTNENMQNYGFRSICNDYAFELCVFINDNYNHIKTIDYGYRYLIFKRK